MTAPDSDALAAPARRRDQGVAADRHARDARATASVAAHGPGAAVHAEIIHRLERGDSAPSCVAIEAPGRPAVLFFDGECGLCRQAVVQIEKRRPGRPLLYIDVHDEHEMRRYPKIDRQRALEKVTLLEPGGEIHEGYDAVTMIATSLPRWQRLHTLLRFWPVRQAGRAAYHIIAQNRHRISRLLGWD